MPSSKQVFVKFGERTKPPLGIIPEKFWLESRIKELISAMERQCHAETVNLDLISKWNHELTKLLELYDELPYGLVMM